MGLFMDSTVVFVDPGGHPIFWFGLVPDESFGKHPVSNIGIPTFGIFSSLISE